MISDKKRIAILLVFVLLFGSVSACAPKNAMPGVTTQPPSIPDTPPEASENQTPAGSDAPNGEDQYSLPPSEEPPEATEEPSQLLPDREEASAIAAELAIADMQVIDFFINLTADGESIFIDTDPSGLEVFPVTVPGYSDYSDLLTELGGIYASEDAYARFFLYPIFGFPQIFSIDNDTFVYPHYFGSFNTRIDVKSIVADEITPDRITFTFNILNHDFFRDGGMSILRTEDGWRLSESFFFYCLRRLDLFDSGSSVSWQDNPILDTEQNTGSAKRFTGSCMFYNVFIEDYESSWDADSIAGLLALQNEAFLYLEDQALNFGHDLSCFATDADSSIFLYIDEGLSRDPDDSSWLDLFLRRTQYGSVNGLLRSLTEIDPYHDNYGLIININKQGRSYAIPCNSACDDHENYYAERAVIYYSTDPDNEHILTGAMIAHVLLRIFGAVELYYPYDGEDFEKQVIMQFFPMEIMHYAPLNMSSATISAFTAFRVGWRNTLPDQLMTLLPDTREL